MKPSAKSGLVGLALLILFPVLVQAQTFELQWGAYGQGPGQLDNAHGIAVDAAGKVYVADTYNARVQVFDSEGAFLTQWGSYSYPTAIAVGAAGRVYVIDADNSRVQVFDSEGAFLTQWGSYGNGPGQFKSPSAIAVDAAGKVYVIDAYNFRVQVFDSEGIFLTQWGSRGDGPDQFSGAVAIAVDAAGRVYVADVGNARVQVFDSEGTFLTQWSSSPFVYYAIAVDAAGKVYATNSTASRVEVFGGDGTPLTQWGEYGEGPGQFGDLRGIAVDAAGKVFVLDYNRSYPYDVSRVQRFSALNQPPVADAGPDQGVEATGPLTSLTLNGSASSDPDGDDLSYSWSENGVEFSTEVSPAVSLALGVHTITLSISDGKGGTAEDVVMVTIQDTTPPVVTPPADVTAEATGPQTAVELGMATAIDLVDGEVAVSSDAPSTFPVGTTLVTWTATDAAGNAGTATQNVMVTDTTPPVVALNGDGVVTVECHTGAYSDPGATALDNVDGDLTGAIATTGSVGTGVPGTYQITYSATDASGNTGSATRTVHVVDTTPPAISLNGANPLLLELGTPYTDPGASAGDLCDGDLSAGIQSSGAVNSQAEGSYTLTYSVADAAGNSASASRTVQVVVTPNSYGLIATHSMHLRQSAQVHSGFAGVVEQGQRPFLAGKVELVVGTRVQTGEAVRLSAPRVRVRQNAHIDGELVYNQLVSVGKHATIAQQTQVPSSYFPLFQDFGLPPFLTSTPGTEDVEVKQKKLATLSAGAYDEVRVKNKGALTFTGGTYHLGDLEVGPNAELRFLAPTTLLIRGQLSLDQNSSFGPGSGSGIDASEILVYVEGRNGRLGNGHDDEEGDDEEDDVEGMNLRRSPRAAKIGVRVSFQGNLYVPNGTIHLRQGAVCVGSFIARDLIVGVRVQVAAQSGWNTPGVIYQPTPPAPLAKPAGAQGEAATLPEGTGLLANYPNPFNPSTAIPYVLSEAGLVKLSIYNVLGQELRVLVDQVQVPGSYVVSWDGQDAAGLPVAGGVYLYRLQAGEHRAVQKMLFAK